jgi:hypothetical protein
MTRKNGIQFLYYMTFGETEDDARQFPCNIYSYDLGSHKDVERIMAKAAQHCADYKRHGLRWAEGETVKITVLIKHDSGRIELVGEAEIIYELVPKAYLCTY